MNKTFYFSKEELLYIADKGGGSFLRDLVQKDMKGIPAELHKEIEPQLRELESPPLLHWKTCKTCGWWLDSMGRCSNKSCKKFLK